DAGAPLNERARSYLQVNCAHCHQFGAGGTADIDLRYDFPIEETKTLDIRPVQGTFDIPDARILAPGDPYRSVLYYRMSKLGGGRMPHIGSDYVDVRGVRLLHDWIRQLPLHKDERAQLAKLIDLHDLGVLVRDREEWPGLVRRTAEGIARAHGRTKVILEDTQQAERTIRAQAAGHVQARAPERKQAILALLSSPTGALMLVHALDERRVPAWAQEEVLQAAGTATGPVRDLFERFIPDDQRVARLGPIIKPEQVLTRKGDIGRGRALFFNNAGLQCIKCHRVGSVGSTLGPDLSLIGKKYTRGQILENILEPSKTIDPKYVAYLVVTDDGKQYTGLLVAKSMTEVVLRTSTDQEIRLPLKKVEQMRSQKTSLMPEQLLRDLTAQEAADLLEFLASLK
ncbi:MAG TPA: hypothetical protein VFA18_25140, partial [Gemmataceae bacterium]|nr:hypothetical protein [Gemmataceae bacterium]